ncbi:PAS domain-containing protein [Oceanimonas sp. NS1]|nr:PAS domain-containing protein [Oceanimonas sp. NS1]
MNKRNQHVIDEEVSYGEREQLVSTTDKRGVITYANEVFCQVAGYTADELVGKNHNLVRHPDMPRAAFRDLWEHVQRGQAWRGAVKNRCKDGRYYWVDAYVTPSMKTARSPAISRCAPGWIRRCAPGPSRPMPACWRPRDANAAPPATCCAPPCPGWRAPGWVPC